MLLIPAAVIATASSPTPAATEESSVAVNTPRSHPNMVLLDLGLHVVGLAYQRTVTPWVAFQVGADAYVPWTQNLDAFGLSGAYRADLVGAIVRARAFFYPLRTAGAGFWISPFAQGGVGWATRNGEKQSGSLWAVGTSVGYSFLIGSRVYLGLGLGLQFHAAHIAGGSDPPSFARFYPTLDINLGYAF